MGLEIADHVAATMDEHQDPVGVIVLINAARHARDMKVFDSVELRAGASEIGEGLVTSSSILDALVPDRREFGSGSIRRFDQGCDLWIKRHGDSLRPIVLSNN